VLKSNHRTIFEKEIVYGYVYDSSGKGHTEPIPMLAGDIPYFIYEYRNSPKLLITDRDDVIILEALKGVVQYCLDTDFLVFNILHFLLPMQLGIEKPKAFTPAIVQLEIA
jgi:hypothetical protein